ncbi:hypothetical protein [Chlorobaculum limnaeum]|nr:hypothetical protein [Chlorobaculum limnaeum]
MGNDIRKLGNATAIRTHYSETCASRSQRRTLSISGSSHRHKPVTP